MRKIQTDIKSNYEIIYIIKTIQIIYYLCIFQFKNYKYKTFNFMGNSIKKTTLRIKESIALKNSKGTGLKFGKYFILK